MRTDYSNDEVVKFFVGGGSVEIENEYQEWFLNNRKLIDRVLDRKVNVFTGITKNNNPCLTYAITVFYVLTD